MKELIKQAAKKLDDQFNFNKIIGGVKGKILEMFDYPFFKGLFTWVYGKLPEEYHDEYRVILESYINDDYTNLKDELVERINKAINIPGLNEEEEAIILNGTFGSFLEVLKRRRERSKPPTSESKPSSITPHVGGGGPGGHPGGHPPGGDDDD